ncbi:unnamed protein product [Cylindrotheca closterium]|uniref:glucan endo-1,3-beta-D-glucosidase n=1 Tax=Cylindrotheca closterium TaxID=2856 RepID=A0AAD2CB41_9STRA|nr:unnamed protein product [Cylindrotheca closterium]
MNVAQQPYDERVALAPNSRPQYYYVYGSVEGDDHVEPGDHDPELEDSLFGEQLITTDHEDEVPARDERDIPHLVITNGGEKNNQYYHGRIMNRCWPYRIGWVPIISLLIVVGVVLILIVIPKEREPMRAYGFVPYGHVDRIDYGDAVEDILSMDLFHPTLISDTKPRAFKFPFPTGAFWTNLVMPTDETDGLSFPIVVYPYAYKWADSGLQLSYPAAHRTVNSTGVHDAFKPDVTIHMVEESRNRYVTKFDPLSVTLRFVSSETSKWETPLVQGSPYSTFRVLSATPVFTSLTTFKSIQCPGADKEMFNDFTDNDDDYRRRLFGVCSIDESDKKKTTIRGVQFIFTSAEGLGWIMFASEPMILEFDTDDRTTIKASTQFTGVIRLAHIPTNSPNEKTTDSDTSTGLRRLIYHAGVYPTGCHVSWDFHSPSPSASSATNSQTPGGGANTVRQASVTFTFGTQTMLDTSHLPSEAAKQLLMLALPHHVEKLPSNVLLKPKKFDLTFRCIKGKMTPVVGGTWTYTEPLLDIGLNSGYKDVDDDVYEILLQQIDDDMGQLLPTTAENIYGFGKQIARLAQLTNIAKRIDREGATANAFLTGVPDRGIALLTNYLEMFLSSQVTDKLLFDSNLGGLVSSNGLLDTEEDFGNGRYNDHHFHYGYILYACAIMGKLDPTFLDRFGPNVDAIFYDVAHPLNGDATEVQPISLFFPLARHKSWFDGHSYGTGLFPIASGKLQESSSEAINCYFGAYAWSLVRHSTVHVDSDMTDFARLLLSTEIRSAKTYWQMVPPTALGVPGSAGVYNREFEEQYMVGNVGMLDVTAKTWLGNDPLHVHINNVLPVTAVTAAIFSPDYVRYQYPYLMKNCKDVEMTYKGYLVVLHAIINTTEAWKEAQELNSWELEKSLSKSEVLYWITQRPGFSNPSLDADDFDESNDVGSASCESHPKCSNITGFCCPTKESVYMGCCE